MDITNEAENIKLIHQVGIFSFEEGWSEFAPKLGLRNNILAKERAKLFFDEIIPDWIMEDKLRNKASKEFCDLYTGISKEAMLFAFLSGYSISKED